MATSRVSVAAGPRRGRERPPGRPAARRWPRGGREHQGARDGGHRPRHARPGRRADPAGRGRRGNRHAGRHGDGPRLSPRAGIERRAGGALPRGGRRALRAARLDGTAGGRCVLSRGGAALPALRRRSHPASRLRRNRRTGRRRREAARGRPGLSQLRPAAHGARDQALHGRCARQPRRGAGGALQRCRGQPRPVRDAARGDPAHRRRGLEARHPGGDPRHRRSRQPRRARPVRESLCLGPGFRASRRRPALPDRACPGRRGRRHPALREARGDRLDADLARDQRHAVCARPAGTRAHRRRLRLAQVPRRGRDDRGRHGRAGRGGRPAGRVLCGHFAPHARGLCGPRLGTRPATDARRGARDPDPQRCLRRVPGAGSRQHRARQARRFQRVFVRLDDGAGGGDPALQAGDDRDRRRESPAAGSP